MYVCEVVFGKLISLVVDVIIPGIGKFEKYAKSLYDEFCS
jgi:hypothetical protein